MIYIVILSVGAIWINLFEKEREENERKIQQADKKRGE